jgi:exodeoxyribonuclease VII large subunit
VAQSRQRLDEGARGLERALKDHRQGLEARLALAGHRLAGVSPAARLLVRRSKLDGFEKRPKEAVDRLLAGKTRELQRVEQRLDAARESAATRLDQSRDRVLAAAGRLELAWTRQRERKAERLAALDQLFGSLNYRAVLSRGYALVRDEAGGLVRSADEAKTAGVLAIEFSEGRVTAAVEGARPAPAARRKAEPRRAVQGTLFDA